MKDRTESQSQSLVYIGSYAEADTPGVYTCQFNSKTGSLEIVSQVQGVKNPTFLDVDSSSNRLYAISETTDADGERRGEAIAFDIEPSTGKLQLLNKERTVSSSTCHITLDHSRQCVVVSSYHGGMIGLSPILADGRIDSTADVHQHTGSSVLPVQSQPRPHSTIFDRSNRFAIVSDLGIDRIKVYRLDLLANTLIPNGEVELAPGSGPRHFVFHPSHPFGYVINELNATITVFSYDEQQGSLQEIQTISTLPESFDGENACADIHISPDGRFLYGSNRGHDSIAIYSIHPSQGTLTLVEHASTQGQHPRNFSLSPDGRFVLVANRDSNNIVTFTRDRNTGKIQPTGDILEISKPVCIKFLHDT